MTRPVETVLVIGGGIGGMSAAIALRQRGVAVDLIDIDPDWRTYGAGITITGPTLRAFHQLGILDEIGREGFFFEQVNFFNQAGDFIDRMETPVLEAGVPPGGAILRPVLHRIMSERTVAEGAQVRLGITIESQVEDEGGVAVRFSDGSQGRYDAIVGADGCHSALRHSLFPDAPPLTFTGQGCWRLIARRAPDVTCSEIYFGEANVKVGISPCSPDTVYMFANLDMPGNPHVADSELVERMRRILEPFGGHVRDICEAIGPTSSVNYRPLSTMLLPLPWHVGRVGLIGDAVHPTTPHLASGAGISVEDGLVLAEELTRADSVEAGWSAFEARRFERVRMVIENSLAISLSEQGANAEPEVRRLMLESFIALAQPI